MFIKVTALCAALLVVTPIYDVGAKKFPSYITPCKRTDPNFSKCYAKAIADLKPYLKTGVKEFGIPPCDPLVIPRLELEQPEGASVGFEAVLTNLTFWGGLDFQVSNFTVDLVKGFLAMEIFFPKLKMLADYKSTGKVLIVQFDGEGKARGDYGNVTVHAEWNADRVMVNGKEHFKVVKDSSTVDVKSIDIEFENLFNGNKQLSDNTNKLINENTELLYTEVKPIIERTLIDLITSVVNNVNTGYSIDELYPA